MARKRNYNRKTERKSEIRRFSDHKKLAQGTRRQKLGFNITDHIFISY